MSELLFHGAAGEVTGSMHMLRVANAWIALDCGLYQGKRQESEEKNRAWPMPPREIAAVVVSHAHTDHTGRLPLLVREGFDGPIYCTAPTRDLCAIMLPDSAHIQQEDTAYVNKKRRRRGMPPVEPLYGHADARATLRLLQTVAYDRWFDVIPGLRARFQDAGHMLGSAGVHLTIGKSAGQTTELFYTGDIGKRDTPILRDPAPLPPADVVICESTYGGRVNEPVADAREHMVDVIRRTYDRGGKVIAPAFSVGRTQTLVYFMHQAMAEGRVPRRPIFVDSPLAVKATEVFRMHAECFDVDAAAFGRRFGPLLDSDMVTYIEDVEESKALHGRAEPCMIISASGMLESGRIRHHIKNNIENPRNTVLIAGFQAANTLGRRLVDGAKRITLFHDEYQVRADVEQIHGFSGHADQRELLALFEPLRSGQPRVFLVHGEPDQGEALAERLRHAGIQNASLATCGMRVNL